MLLHQALDETIKYCRMSATELAEASGVSSSRISQFRNGLFLEGKGSDLTSRAINDLIDAAAYIDPKARRVFSFFLADLDPKSIKSSFSVLDPKQLDAMDSAQISQLLIAIANRLDKPKPAAKKVTHNQKNSQHLVNALNAS